MRSSVHLVCGAAFVSLCMAVSPALAEEGPQPQRTTATYGNWTVRCQVQGNENAKRMCEIAQAITIQGHAGPIAQLAFGRRDDDADRIVVQLPLDVWLPADVNFMADESVLASAEFKRCFPQFCLAEATVDEATVEKMRSKPGEGSIRFKDAAQRDIAIPLSFDGFAEAHDALLAAEGGQ